MFLYFEHFGSHIGGGSSRGGGYESEDNGSVSSITSSESDGNYNYNGEDLTEQQWRRGLNLPSLSEVVKLILEKYEYMDNVVRIKTKRNMGGEYWRFGTRKIADMYFGRKNFEERQKQKHEATSTSIFRSDHSSTSTGDEKTDVKNEDDVILINANLNGKNTMEQHEEITSEQKTIVTTDGQQQQVAQPQVAQQQVVQQLMVILAQELNI